jgi:hypothetical protein
MTYGVRRSLHHPLHWRWSSSLKRPIRDHRRSQLRKESSNHDWILKIPGAEQKLVDELARRLYEGDVTAFPWLPGAVYVHDMLELERRGISRNTRVCLVTSPSRIRVTSKGVRLFGKFVMDVSVGGFVLARVNAKLPMAKFVWSRNSDF